MKKNGFTLVELLATIVIIAVIMGIVFPSITKISDKNKNKICEEYEKIIEEYSLANMNQGQNIVFLSDLGELKKIKNECIGYAIKINNEPIEYRAYIKCQNQCASDGFDEKKLEQ